MGHLNSSFVTAVGHLLVCFENNSNVQGLAGGGGMGISGRDLAPAEVFSDKENERVFLKLACAPAMFCRLGYRA